MTYSKDEMAIHWHLNQSMWGSDAAFKKVVLQLCFGAPSQAARPWRQPNNVLSHSKNCKYTIASQPYNAFGNNTVWRPSQDTPGAKYFVRAWVLNSTDASATISANSVAYGQNTDPSMNTNLVVVTPFDAAAAAAAAAAGGVGAPSSSKVTRAPVLRLDAMGREIDEHGNVVERPKIAPVSTLKVNINKAKKEAFKILRPELEEDPHDSPFFDPRMASERLKLVRPRKASFQFVEEGTFARQAETMRMRAQFGVARQMEMAARQRAKEREAAEGGDNPNLVEVGQRPLHPSEKPKPPIPDVEWWDAIILASNQCPEEGSAVAAALKASKITMYVEHPVPIEPPAEAPPPPPQPLRLTKREQKKLRTQRRVAREKERQEMVRQGLLEPPKPKVKMSNLMRVMAAEATQDPTKMEKEVRAAAAEREQAHVDRNLARKLTPAERKEKKERKLFEETLGGGVGGGGETHVAVFKVRHLLHPQTRFKVDVNAQENRLTGCALLADSFALVVVEGVSKSVKRYLKLMMRRIHWADAVAPGVAGEEDESIGEMGVKRENKCELVWQGLIPGAGGAAPATAPAPAAAAPAAAAPSVGTLPLTGVAGAMAAGFTGLPGMQAVPGSMFPNMFPFAAAAAQGGMPTQATRHARRVYVGGLPPMANEQSVAAFFNNAMTLVNGNTAGPGDCVVYVYINQEKKFAFVEMRTVEEASNAMALDGINFEGVSVRVRRPSDYNPSMAATLGPTQPSPNLNLAAVGLTAGGSGGADGPDRIFVGGLPYYLTEEQIRELLSSFGPLRAFDLVKDRDTGNSKGYGFCVYQDPSVTDIACMALNGMKMGDKTLTVRRATASGQAKPEQANVLAQAQQQIALSWRMALTGANTVGLGAAAVPGAAVDIPTKIICLSQVVSPNELTNDEDYDEIMEDMREECAKYGSLVNVVIPRPPAPGATAPGVGKVFVEYGDTAGALKAKAALHGRKFGGNAVVAIFYPEDAYARADYSKV
ncbi:unnamed protein product [Closterium sp. Yama58-4]|nr:unnamed protein product [Closterium sp. Yama58-4]